MLFVTVSLVFFSVALFCYSVVPILYGWVVTYNQKRTYTLASKLDRVLPRKRIEKIQNLYWIAPIAGGVLAYFFAPQEIRFFTVVLSATLGLFFPGVYVKAVISQNKQKFENQLLDALMIMSSSFRGGLSLIQAMEAVVEEMPDPINQEFLTVLGENKMGVSLEEALNHLYYRMPSPALQQMITAILLARETGLKSDFLRLRALPCTKEALDFIKVHKTIYIVESNRDGQLCQILSATFSDQANKFHSIAHTDGLPLTAKWVTDAIRAKEKE